MPRHLFLLLTFLIVNQAVSTAARVTATKNGAWSDASNWQISTTGSTGLPNCGDSVVIPAGITITVSAQQSYGCTPPLNILVEGTVQFTTGNKLILPCGSTITIRSNGLILPGGGGGNSNYITICNTAVWNAGNGSLPGPVVLQIITLPIELVSFTATPSDNDVRLDWITATEINNDYFTLERSADLSAWESLASVEGAGNSSVNLAYAFTDNAPLRGVSYYRLRQTDYDGKTSCSDPVAVDRKHSSKNILVSAALGDARLTIDYLAAQDGTATIIVSDMSGAESFRGVVALVEGNNMVHLSTPVLSNGIHFVRVEFGQDIQGVKTTRN